MTETEKSDRDPPVDTSEEAAPPMCEIPTVSAAIGDVIDLHLSNRAATRQAEQARHE